METKESVKGKSLEALWQSAYNAHSGTSFVPEKRATDLINEFSEELDLDLAGMPEEYRTRYKESYIKVIQSWLYSKSRVYSTMITGPANFPAERMRKRNQSEDNKWVFFREWRGRALRGIRRTEARKTEVLNPQGKLNTEWSYGDITVVTNYDLDRVQIIFPGKPEESVRKLLSGSGWKWSPTNKAWQRKLTGNAQHSAHQIITSIQTVTQ